MTAAEEYRNRVKVAMEKAYVTDVEAQILLSGLVEILDVQTSILKKLTALFDLLSEIHKDIPS